MGTQAAIQPQQTHTSEPSPSKHNAVDVWIAAPPPMHVMCIAILIAMLHKVTKQAEGKSCGGISMLQRSASLAHPSLA